MRAAGPEIPGSGHFLVCDGAIWISVLDYADSGRTLFQVDYDSALCFSSKQGRLRDVSAGDNWDYCDGTSWSAFGSGGGALYVTNGRREYGVVLTPLGGVRVHIWNPSGV